MSDYVRVEKEYYDALRDVQDERAEYGKPAVFKLNAEDVTTRDKYNSIKSRNTPQEVSLKAFPIEENPTARQYEKAGIRTPGKCLIYTAKKDWEDAGVSFESIDLARTQVLVLGRTYEVVDKNRIGQIGDDYLYYVFSAGTR